MGRDVRHGNVDTRAVLRLLNCGVRVGAVVVARAALCGRLALIPAASIGGCRAREAAL
jgi:hypothetical protein